MGWNRAPIRYGLTVTVTAGLWVELLLPVWLASPLYVAVMVRVPVVVKMSEQLESPVPDITAPEQTSPVVAVNVTDPVGL